MNLKALILAAGKGKRTNGIFGNKNKCLVCVNNKPLIEYSLDYASLHKFSEIIIVVGHRGKYIIKNYKYKYGGIPIKYVWQKEQKGIVHAINCAKKILKGSDFMLMLGDEILIDGKHDSMIKKFKKENLFIVCGTIIVKDKDSIKNTYAVIKKNNGRIVKLIEKPQKPINNIMGTGICLFKNDILSYIDKTPINPKRGEKELVDLISCAIKDGKIVKSTIIGNKFFNINYEKNFLEAKEYFNKF